MLASGFTAAPVSKYLFFGIIAFSILASITDSKYLFEIQVVPHLWRHKQIWRLLVWQVRFQRHLPTGPIPIISSPSTEDLSTENQTNPVFHRDISDLLHKLNLAPLRRNGNLPPPHN